MPYILAIPFSVPIAEAAFKAIVTAVGFNLISKALAPKLPPLNNAQQVEYSGTVEPRRIIYGTVLASGINGIPPWCSWTNNEELHQLLILAGHPVDAITDVYYGQDCILSADIGAITNDDWSGWVYGSTRYNGRSRIRRYNGVSNPYDTFLHRRFGSAWPTTSTLSGLAYMALMYDANQTAFPQGKPDVRAIVRGKRVYDPRRDTSPGAHPTDPANIVFSSNPALCIADFICDDDLGVGEAYSRMDWPTVVAAATVCEETVSIPGPGTQPRFTCNIVLDCSAAYEDNLALLKQSMLGDVLYTGGKWRLIAGKAAGSTFTLGDADLAGHFEERTAYPYQDRFNAVRGQFMDAGNYYQAMEYPSVRVLADEDADGEGPIWHDANFQACTDKWECQRNAIITQRIGRRKKQWTGDFGPTAFPIRPGEWGELSIAEWNLVSQVVRCSGWHAQPNGRITLVLDEIGATDYLDPDVSLYQNPAAIGGVPPADFIPGPVTGAGFTSVPGGIQFYWQLPSLWYYVLAVELLEAATNDIAGAAVVWSGANSGHLVPKTDQTTRYYWLRVRNLKNNQTSTTAPSSPTGGMAAAALKQGALSQVDGITAGNVTTYVGAGAIVADRVATDGSTLGDAGSNELGVVDSGIATGKVADYAVSALNTAELSSPVALSNVAYTDVLPLTYTPATPNNVQLDIGVTGYADGAGDFIFNIKVLRDGTQLFLAPVDGATSYAISHTGSLTFTFTIVDNYNSTASRTYKIQGKQTAGSGGHVSKKTWITAQENKK